MKLCVCKNSNKKQNLPSVESSQPEEEDEEEWGEHSGTLGDSRDSEPFSPEGPWILTRG